MIPSATPADVFVAETNGVVHGVVACSDEQMHSLFVDPSSWRRGIASALERHACEVLAHRGIHTAELWVMEANAAARAFYAGRGWQADGRRERSPFPPEPPMLGYAKDLPPVPLRAPEA